MEMAFPAALFLHILGALGLAFANGLEFMLVRGLRRSSADQIVVWADVYRVLPVLGGGSLALILVTGLYMMVVRGPQAWMLVALAAVVLIAIVGASSGIRLRNAVRAAAGSPAATGVQRALRQWIFPASNRLRIALLVGLLSLMVFKPDLVGSIAAVTGTVGLGVIWCIPVVTAQTEPSS